MQGFIDESVLFIYLFLFLCVYFTQKFKMPAKSSGKKIFAKSRQWTPDILDVKNFDEIALSRSVFEINEYLCLTQKFKMAAKSGGKTFLCEIMAVDSADTLWVKYFVEIALSRSIAEINTFLHFTQKFKMAAKSGGKTILEKSNQ